MPGTSKEHQGTNGSRHLLRSHGMLLAVQATRVHAFQLSTDASKILLAMWEGWRVHARMSPAGGKRRPDRGHRGRAPVPEISYTLRPHVTVHIGDFTCQALLDTWSEATFINRETADYLQGLGYPRRGELKRVWLADGSRANTHGSITCPFKIWGKRINHEAQIMVMDIAILIGVDLWARTRQAIPPPPIRTDARNPEVHRVEK